MSSKVVLLAVVASVVAVLLVVILNRPAETARPPLDVIQEALDQDAAKGRFTGRLEDFIVYPQVGPAPEEAFIFRCSPHGTTPVSDAAVLIDHELWSEAFGSQGIGWACGEDGVIVVNNEGGDGHGAHPDGVLLVRGYFQNLPVPVLRDAPRDRLELIDIEGHPALIERGVQGYPYARVGLVVIERYPDGQVPGIVVRVEFSPSAERAIELAEQLMP